MKHEPTANDLLERLLNGEANDDSLRLLADLAAEDTGFAGKVGEELEFAELVRQVFRDDADRSREQFEAAKAAHALDVEELEERICDGSATPQEIDRLVPHLWESPERVRLLRRRLAEDEWMREAASASRDGEAFIEALETRMWAETTQDHFVEDFAERLEREVAAEEADNIVPMPFSWGRTLAPMGAVAAAVAVGAFVLTQLMTGRLLEERIVATVIKASQDASWSGDLFPDAEGGVPSGQYHLESGVVALRFSSGSEMTVEGPAVFEVDEDGGASVIHGVALAKAAAPELGITLRSRGLNVAEPAALIGIDARSEHSTEAVVFSGGGGICYANGGCRPLASHEAIQADLTRDRLVNIPYNPRPFRKAWEMLAGVEKNMGAVRIELPGAEIQPAVQEGEVQVYLENESFVADTGIEVDEIRVGEFAAVGANPGQSLQAGSELKSYLLQTWATNGNEEEDEVEASVTFDQPVVGVIYSSDRLASSDRSVGTSITHGGEDFARGRGLDSGIDEILLSDDRRTLNLKLRGKDLEVDQVRVIVAAK